MTAKDVTWGWIFKQYLRKATRYYHISEWGMIAFMMLVSMIGYQGSSFNVVTFLMLLVMFEVRRMIIKN